MTGCHFKRLLSMQWILLVFHAITGRDFARDCFATTEATSGYLTSWHHGKMSSSASAGNRFHSSSMGKPRAHEQQIMYSCDSLSSDNISTNFLHILSVWMRANLSAVTYNSCNGSEILCEGIR